MLHPDALSPVAFSFKTGLLRGEQAMQVDSNDTLSERAELHFLAALVDELMRKYADRPMGFADATLVHLARRDL